VHDETLPTMVYIWPEFRTGGHRIRGGDQLTPGTAGMNVCFAALGAWNGELGGLHTTDDFPWRERCLAAF
jgi:hypothetical protein